MSRTPRLQRAALATIAAATVIPVATAVASTPPTSEPVEETQPTLLPLAPDGQRVDLEPPAFSEPTTIDNPLFPISDLHSAVLVGNNEGRPIRIETTLMPSTVVIEVDGDAVRGVGVAVRRLPGRSHPRSRHRLVRPRRRRSRVVPRRGRLQLRGGCRRRHRRHVDGRARRRPAGDDHAGRPPRRRGVPPREHRGRADGGGHDRRGRRHDRRAQRTRRGLHRRPGEPHPRGRLRRQVVLPRLRRILLRRR